jgi:drug/metabolite transporter (DMT)-like permease
MLLWGSLFPMVKLGFKALETVTVADILTFAGIRFFICGAIICVYSAVFNKASYKSVGGSVAMILASGFFAIILHYSFNYLGLNMTDSSKAALIKQIGSLLYVCFSFVFIKEDKPTLIKIVSAVIGFIGIAVLNLSSEGFSVSMGDVLILCASFCYVISNIISKKVFVKAEPTVSTGISHFFGGGVLLIVGLLMGGKIHFTSLSGVLIFAYICAASVVSYCLWFSIVKNGELSKLLILKFAEPVFACIFGAVILGENIFKVQYLAAFIIISGAILLSNLSKKA